MFLLLIVFLGTSANVAANPVNLEGINRNGRFLVPMRSIFENLGASENWDGATKTVTGIKDGVEIKLSINNINAYVDGELKVLDVPAALENGRTYVPARFVSEALDANVGWDGTKRMASVSLGNTLLHIYEDLPPEPEVIVSENITHTINPRVVKNGGNQTITLEAIIKDDDGSPLEGVPVEFFISSREISIINQIVYENDLTNEDGHIKASYTTSSNDNDRNFLVKIATMIDDTHIETESNFLVTNANTAKVKGVVYHPETSKPEANVLITANFRDPLVYKEIAMTNSSGEYDAYIPVIPNREYFIGANFDRLIDVKKTHQSSHSFISPSRFTLEQNGNIKAGQVHEINFDYGFVTGKSVPNSDIYMMPYINNTLNNQDGVALTTGSDGSYLVPLKEGKYKFLDMKTERTIKDGVAVTMGKTTDVGTFTR